MGWFLVAGLLLTGAACKEKPDTTKKCSKQMKCEGGFKCEKEDGSGPITGSGEVGICVKDPCAITVPCEKPIHSQPKTELCLDDEVIVCDHHDPHKFC
jgi:hypothetical protein